MNPAIARVPFDTLRDFAPVTLLAGGPLILLAHPLVPVKTVRDLDRARKSEAGQLNYWHRRQRHDDRTSAWSFSSR